MKNKECQKVFKKTVDDYRDKMVNSKSCFGKRNNFKNNFSKKVVDNLMTECYDIKVAANER